jgi:ABC-2 type transport system permease protein
MSWRVIRTLVAKDVSLYFKNRFFALVTVLALVAYAVLFFVMPASVDETFEIGIYAPNLPVGILDRLAGDGLAFVPAPSREALEAAVLGNEQPVGVVLEAGDVVRLLAGQRGRIEVLFASALPGDFRDLYTTALEELGFLLSGQPLSVEIEERVLGPDLAGRQIPPRERLLPMMAVFILMVETMGLHPHHRRGREGDAAGAAGHPDGCS